MKRYFLPVIVLISISINCYAQSYLTQLNTVPEFDKLSGPPLANKYGNVKAVKVVYDLKAEKLYYLNESDYKNHYEFCNKELNYLDGMGNFLTRNYSNGKERKYLLANLNFFQSCSKYVLEISPTDLMEQEQITQIYNLVKNSSFVGENIFFITNSPRLQSIENFLNEKIKTISPFEIYGSLSYQAVCKYTNKGILRFVESDGTKEIQYNATDILILKSIPNYLPPVAGVIVTEFQTPLSHISILGLNRKIPICAYTKIFEIKALRELDGKQVRFEVDADSFRIEPDTTTLNRQVFKKIELELNVSVDSLIDAEYLNSSSFPYVGSKAANFAELYHLSKTAGFKTPECAFAIPFYFYMQHIKKAKAGKLITKLSSGKLKDQEDVERYLKKIRAKIEKTKIDETLIKEVEKKMASNGKYRNFRFRSSTNAEDIEGFSGAGLYTSETGKLNSKDKTIENAIKRVWASNWSDKAYYERKFYNIDQTKVAMGILVHRSFPKEEVNGVAITKNIYRKNSNGFLINAQIGNENVVKPSPGVICDQFLCFPENSNKIYKDKIVIDVITYSSLNNNKLVMTEEEIQHLADQLDIIKKHFTGDIDKWSYTRKGYDVEFKLDGKNRQLYIKQIRPYND